MTDYPVSIKFTDKCLSEECGCGKEMCMHFAAYMMELDSMQGIGNIFKKAGMSVRYTDPFKNSEYGYFDFSLITREARITKDEAEEARGIFGMMDCDRLQVTTSYPDEGREINCRAFYEFPTGNADILFSASGISKMHCDVQGCMMSALHGKNRTELCVHQIAVLMAAEKRQAECPIADATDRFGSRLMDIYGCGRRKENVIKNVRLEASLEKGEGELWMSFKIAWGQNRAYAVKDVRKLACCVDCAGKFPCGNDEVDFSEQYFDENSEQMFRLIKDALAQERMLEQMKLGRMQKDGSRIRLAGWLMDELYEAVKSGGVKLYDRDGSVSGKIIGRDVDAKEAITIRVRQEEENIHIKGIIPELACGIAYSYYIDEGYLNRVKADGRISRIMEEYGGEFEAVIGSGHVRKFMEEVLPQLKREADVKLG